MNDISIKVGVVTACLIVGDKKLSETEEGCKLLRAKYDGATQLLIEWAMTNPALSQKLSKFLDGWKSKSEEYLKTLGG